jgi:hypothetical protein
LSNVSLTGAQAARPGSINGDDRHNRAHHSPQKLCRTYTRDQRDIAPKDRTRHRASGSGESAQRRPDAVVALDHDRSQPSENGAYNDDYDKSHDWIGLANFSVLPRRSTDAGIGSARTKVLAY